MDQVIRDSVILSFVKSLPPLLWSAATLVVDAIKYASRASFPPGTEDPMAPWKRPLFELFPTSGIPYAMIIVPVAMVMGHYAFYALGRVVFPDKPIDRSIWLSMSIGSALTWNCVFFKVLPVGTLLFEKHVATNAAMSLVFFAAIASFYFTVTAMTSNSAPPFFMLQKLIPAVLVISFMSIAKGARVASTGEMTVAGLHPLVGWLLRFYIVDALIDFYWVRHTPRGMPPASALLVGGINACNSLLWYQFFSVYGLHEYVGLHASIIAASFAFLAFLRR